MPERHGHHRERDDRDRVEVEQRPVVVGEPGQPAGQHPDHRDAEPPVAPADPQDRGGDQREHGDPPQGRGADAADHPDAVVRAGAAVRAGLDVVDRVDPDRPRDDQPAGRVGVVGVLGVVDEVAGVEVPDVLLVMQPATPASRRAAASSGRPGCWLPSPGRSRRRWTASPPRCPGRPTPASTTSETKAGTPSRSTAVGAGRRRRPAGGPRRPRPGTAGRTRPAGTGRSTCCRWPARSTPRRRAATAARPAPARTGRRDRAGRAASRWSASRLRNQSRSAARQLTAATTKKARKMSSSAVRDITNASPSKASSSPARPPIRVDRDTRRTRRMVTRTSSVPKTSGATRQPNGVHPEDRLARRRSATCRAAGAR